MLENIRLFFFKYRIFILAILLFLCPVAVLDAIHFGNHIFYWTGFSINPQGIGNGEIYIFWGSYLGGIATLIALMLTIQHNRDMVLYQIGVAYLNTERENISKALAKVNTLIANSIWRQYMSALYENKHEWQNELADIFKKISFEREQIVIARNELLLTSEILDNYETCQCCHKKEKCEIDKYRQKFSTLYFSTEEIVYNTLYLLEEFVKIDSKNFSYKMNIAKAKQIYTNPIEDKQKEDLDEIIQSFEEMLKPDSEILNQLKEAMDQISKAHHEDKTKLIYLAKSYYFAKQERTNSNCFRFNTSSKKVAH